jgi:hypothetical protein
MKRIILSAILAGSALFTTQQAAASACNMWACKVTITSDTANSRGCNHTGTSCSCQDLATANGVPYRIQSTSPGSQWVNYGLTIDGTRSCWLGDYLNSQPTENLEPSQASSSLEEVFAPKVTTVYYGYISDTNRSPNTGRSTSIMARLDVCMGDGDATNAVATMNANTCYNSYCGSGAINEYCNASVNNGGTVEAAGVCHDRCECAINGTTHATCNQL